MSNPLDSEPTQKRLNPTLRGKDLRSPWQKLRLAFRRKNLAGYDLRSTIMSGNWSGWNFTGSDMRGLTVLDATFAGAIFTDTDMRGIMCVRVNFYDAVAPDALMNLGMFDTCNMANVNGRGVKSNGIHLVDTNTNGMIVSTLNRPAGERVRPANLDTILLELTGS